MKFRIVKSKELGWGGEEVSEFRVQLFKPAKFLRKAKWIDCYIGRDGFVQPWKESYYSFERADERIKFYLFRKEKEKNKNEQVIKEYEI